MFIIDIVVRIIIVKMIILTNAVSMSWDMRLWIRLSAIVLLKWALERFS